MGQHGNPVRKTTGVAMLVSGNPLADGCSGTAESSEYTYLPYDHKVLSFFSEFFSKLTEDGCYYTCYECISCFMYGV